MPPSSFARRDSLNASSINIAAKPGSFSRTAISTQFNASCLNFSDRLCAFIAFARLLMPGNKREAENGSRLSRRFATNSAGHRRIAALA